MLVVILFALLITGDVTARIIKHKYALQEQRCEHTTGHLE